MKKIVHIMIAADYKEGYGYQENILPCKHKELGYDVQIITYNQGGEASYNNGEGAPLSYINKDGICVNVLKSRSENLIDRIPKLRAFTNTLCYKTKGLYHKLTDIHPDIIFVHGVSVMDHLIVLRYVKKNNNTRLYIDNHNDYYNSSIIGLNNYLSRKIVGGYIGSRVAKVANKCWAVTPWRVDYMNEVFRVPRNKIELLVMGGDENLINWDQKNTIRENIRETLHIPLSAFVVATGGKIDKAKNIHLLVDAIKKIENVYLIIFGRYEGEMSNYVDSINCKRIINVGWIPASESYNYFLASDLACFPGTHSVLWEQSCASGVPGIFKDWNGGFNHVDVGGNCILLKEISVDSLYNNIKALIDDCALYNSYAENASTKARFMFSYKEIAKKAVEYNLFEGEKI